LKILVAYYSRSGNTRAAVEKVRSFLNEPAVTLWEIPEEGTRDGAVGWVRSCLEGIRKKTSTIAPPPFRVGDFDLVVLGTPVWANSPASAIRAFCRAGAGDFRKVAFLGTHGGGGTGKAFAQMTELCGMEPVATLTLRDKVIREAGGEKACRAFAADLLKTLSEDDTDVEI
jgi:flavodoxin